MKNYYTFIFWIIILVNPVFLLGQSKIYWIEDEPDRLIQANVDGSNTEILLENYLGLPFDIIVEEAIGKIFWISQWGTVHQSDLDGNNIKLLFKDEESIPFRLALNATKDYFYWMHNDFQAVIKIPLNGGDLDTIPISTPGGFLPTIDTLAEKIYYFSDQDKGVYRMDLNGTNGELLFQRPSNITDLALDIENGKIYFTERSEDLILRANLDGSEVDTLITGYSSETLQLDLDKKIIYFTGRGSENYTHVYQANLDGSSIESVYKIANDGILGFDIDFQSQKLYLGLLHKNTIQQVDLDGQNEITFLENPFEDLVSLIINQEKQQFLLQVDNNNAREIWITNLEGVLIQKMYLGNILLDQMFLDEQNEHIYWTTRTSNQVYRYDLETKEIKEVLVYPTNGSIYGEEIEIDYKNENLYWIESSPPPHSEEVPPLQYIKRIDFNATQIDTIAIDTFIYDLKLDLERGELYWANRAPYSNGSIHKSDLDGQNQTKLLDGLYYPNSIELDLKNEKIYWAEGIRYSPERKIYSSDFDGTNKLWILSSIDKEFSIFSGIIDFIPQTSLANNHIKIFPNPAHEQIHVDLTTYAIPFSNHPYSIFDYTGRILQSGLVNSPISTIDINPLPSGTYFLSVQVGERRISSVFIITR